MLSARPFLCNIFWCFLVYSQPNDDLLSVLGRIAMWYLTLGKMLELMLVCVLVDLQVTLM